MGVIPARADARVLAERFASELQLPLLGMGTDPATLPPGQLALWVESDAAALRITGAGAPGPVPVTFRDPALLHRRRGGQNELLGRAVGCRRGRTPTVLDATAGFGGDAFVLADHGCRVRMCERNPVMATLLRHALCAAQNDEDPWLREVTSRMTLLPRDACSLDAPSLADVDTIYLDPMFRVSRKAAPGKGMQALNLLLDGDAAEDSLLTWALRQRVQRVVVKRPRRAAALPGPSPGHVLTGRSVRFDVYPGAAGTGRHD